MSEFYTFAGEHPVLTFFLAWLLLGAIRFALWQPFRTVNRIIRMRNIAARGWPPEHLDADGDFRPPSETA